MLYKIMLSKNGQAIIETALVLPIVVLIFTGIIDFGVLFGNYTLITSISRESARYAAIGESDCNIRNIAANMAQPLNHSKMRMFINPSETHRHRGQEVTITVEYDNDIFTPIISAVVGNSIKLTAKTTMRVE